MKKTGSLCSLRAVSRDLGPDLGRTLRRRPSTDTDAGFALRRYVDLIAPRSPSPSDVYEDRLTLKDLSSSELTPNESRSGHSELVNDKRCTDIMRIRSIKTAENSSSALDSPSDIVDCLQRAANQQTTLHNAAVEGDDLVVQQLLSEGIDVDIKTPDGKTALHLAVEFGNAEVVQTLLQNRANVNIQSNGRGSSGRSSPMDRRFYGGRTPLHWAAAGGYEHIIRLLLEYHADPAIRNVAGRIALQEAIKNRHDGSAKLLIENGAPIQNKDVGGWSALHGASFEGRLGICKILVAKGAELDAPTSNGTTALAWAVDSSHAACVKYLMLMGANFRTENLSGDQPIHTACRRGSLPIVRMLLDAGVDIEVRDSVQNETPLLKAASTGKTDVILFLLERGADMRAKTLYGRDVLQHARLHEPGVHEEAVRLIETWASNR